MTDLWVALGIQNQGSVEGGGKPSRYALYKMNNGTTLLISIRASAHNANANNYFAHQPVHNKNLSIVLLKKMKKNHFKSNQNVNLGEFVYINEKIKNVDNPLSKIAYSLINYLDTGNYIDETRVAIKHGEITENKNKINCITNMRRNRVRLTESQLHRVINESVKQVLTELDWKTYANARNKARERGDLDYWRERGDNLYTGVPKAVDARLRADRFGQASKNAFNRDYGYENGNYWDNDYENVELGGDFNSTEEFAPHVVGHRSKGYGAPYKYEFGTRYDGFSGKKMTPEELFSNDSNAADTYRKASDEYKNFKKGNYEYVKGKGWQLKDDMDESIRRAIRKVLR